MTSEAILAILKFAGPVVALITGIWSTTQKITYEDGGTKRLTLQGRLLIGINVLSMLISILALGFEANIKDKQALQAATDRLAAAEKDRLEADEKAKDRADAAARAQAAALGRIEADAKEQNRFLGQRFLIVDKAAEQQRRDAEIARAIAREANLRLAAAERVLAEFERVNYPLREIEANVVLALDFTGVDLTRFWTAVAARTDLQSRPRSRGFTDRTDRIVSFTPDDFRQEPRIVYGTRGTRIALEFREPLAGRFARGDRDALLPIEGVVESPRSRLPQVRLEATSIEADLKARTLTAYYTGTFKPEIAGEVSSDQKLSLSDVKRLLPVLTIRRGTTNIAARRPPDRIERVSFSLNGDGRFDGDPKASVSDEARFVLVPDASRR